MEGGRSLFGPEAATLPQPDLRSEFGARVITMFGHTGTVDDLLKMCPVDPSHLTVEACNEVIVVAMNESEQDIEDKYEDMFKDVLSKKGLEPKFTISEPVTPKETVSGIELESAERQRPQAQPPSRMQPVRPVRDTASAVLVSKLEPKLTTPPITHDHQSNHPVPHELVSERYIKHGMAAIGIVVEKSGLASIDPDERRRVHSVHVRHPIIQETIEEPEATPVVLMRISKVIEPMLAVYIDQDLRSGPDRRMPQVQPEMPVVLPETTFQDNPDIPEPTGIENQEMISLITDRVPSEHVQGLEWFTDDVVIVRQPEFIEVGEGIVYTPIPETMQETTDILMQSDEAVSLVTAIEAGLPPIIDDADWMESVAPVEIPEELPLGDVVMRDFEGAMLIAPELPSPISEIESVVERLYVILGTETQSMQMAADPEPAKHVVEAIVRLPPLTDETGRAELELEQLFIELFEEAGIEYSPELVESFIRLTRRHCQEEPTQEIAPDQDDDQVILPTEIGTREFLQKIHHGLSAIKQAVLKFWTIGRSVLRLYTSERTTAATA